jgi:hypothetical protein
MVCASSAVACLMDVIYRCKVNDMAKITNARVSAPGKLSGK